MAENIFKKYLNDMPIYNFACNKNCSGGCGGFNVWKPNVSKHYCDPNDYNLEDHDDCDACDCEECSCDKDCAKKGKTKDNKNDGCFCRKCHDFIYMAEPDDKDGKCTCYRCG